MTDRTTKPIHIVNVPLDLGASRRGTDAGPSAMRIAGLKAGLEQMGLQCTAEVDVPVPIMESHKPENPKARFKAEILEVCQALAAEVIGVMEADGTPLVIGGDHSIAMGTVSGLAAHLRKADQDLGLIWFDAHGDMNRPDSSPSGNIHGMPLAHLLGFGDPDLASISGISPAVKPEHVVLIGIRDIDRKEREFINASGVTSFTMRDIDQLGMFEVTKRALEILNNGTVGFHVSFDLDGCDPSVIPGTGTRVPGGVTYREAHLLLEECASHGGLLAMEMVELNPFLDNGNVSAHRAVALIESAFGKDIL